MLDSKPIKPGSLYSRLTARMRCSIQALGLSSLALGLLATGALSLAVATDYWLYTGEMISEDYPDGDNVTFKISSYVTTHSGLWRACVLFEITGLAGHAGEEMMVEQGAEVSADDDYIADDTMADDPESERPPVCYNIAYQGQESGRQDGADTTNSILRAIRKSSPVLVASLFFQITALALSTVGNTKKNAKTLVGAVCFISSALILAIGVIFYISGVNDEVSHRKEPKDPQNDKGKTFTYEYGWAFFFAGSSFMLSMMAAVSNISLYLRRYPNLEDMVQIIPGLDKRGGFVNVSGTSRAVEEEMEYNTPYGAQNPTIIL